MKKILLSAVFGALTLPAYADTTDQKWMTIVELKKQRMHCVDDSNRAEEARESNPEGWIRCSCLLGNLGRCPLFQSPDFLKL